MKKYVIVTFYLQPNKKYHYLIIGTFCYKNNGQTVFMYEMCGLFKNKVKKEIIDKDWDCYMFLQVSVVK